MSEESPKKSKAAGEEKPVRPRPVKKDDAAAKARREAAEAKAAASEEEDEAEDAIEGTDQPEKPERVARADKKHADDDEEGDAQKKKVARPKAALKADVKLALEQRKETNARRPAFYRQEWFRYQRLGDKWRFPQGIQSKMRRNWKSHPTRVSIGYRGPRKARGLHPSGFREVLIDNESKLAKVDKKTEAVRIASSVGARKREEIQKRARKLGIRVLNWRG